MKKITTNTNVSEVVCKLYAEHENSPQSISEKLDIDKNTIYKILRKNNITLRPRTQKRVSIPANELAELIASGYDLDKLSEHYGCCKETVKKRLTDYNLSIPCDTDGFAVTPDEIKSMYMLRMKGYSNSEIAKKLGRTTRTIQYHIGQQPTEITKARFRMRSEIISLRSRTRREAALQLEARFAEEARIAEEKRIREEEERVRKEEEHRAAIAEKQNELTAKLAAWGISCESLTVSELNSAATLVAILENSKTITYGIA